MLNLLVYPSNQHLQRTIEQYLSDMSLFSIKNPQVPPSRHLLDSVSSRLDLGKPTDRALKMFNYPKLKHAIYRITPYQQSCKLWIVDQGSLSGPSLVTRSLTPYHEAQILASNVWSPSYVILRHNGEYGKQVL